MLLVVRTHYCGALGPLFAQQTQLFILHQQVFEQLHLSFYGLLADQAFPLGFVRRDYLAVLHELLGDRLEAAAAVKHQVARELG